MILIESDFQILKLTELFYNCNTYRKNKKGIKLLDKEEFHRRYIYSSLQYFHDILGIE